MRILISGANGFIGSALSPYLTSHGHTVTRLVRRAATTGDIIWNPEAGALDASVIEGFEAVIHLAGANIAGGRWTTAYKREIWDSRIRSTELLVNRIQALRRLPQIFVCMSAVGYYGNRSDEVLTEDSPPGNDFMAQLCVAWEKATQPLAEKGVRVANLRAGLVLSAQGGALKKMLLPFKLGLGGSLGSGNQYWSWITLDDFLAAVEFILTHDRIVGPVNMVAPNPVTNSEFAAALAGAVHRPAIFPVPAFVLRTVFGEMADALFFASQRVMADKLITAGFKLGHPHLGAALRAAVSS
jgi:hypothetical protein